MVVQEFDVRKGARLFPSKTRLGLISDCFRAQAHKQPAQWWKKCFHCGGERATVGWKWQQLFQNLVVCFVGCNYSNEEWHARHSASHLRCLPKLFYFYMHMWVRTCFSLPKPQSMVVKDVKPRSLSGSKKLLGAKGIATRSKRTLLGAPGLTTRNNATRSKDATRGSWHRY